ncbi:hypothetical protein CKA55_07345 [Arcobacter suis]|uniref:Uncharacterized protein n=1 Tax=Arcobacter suis CECT 7833 TaxID=663365 RepID=A0AAD0WQ08_9BACT|nr:hypothetical protein [Arcobacter suis]AXX89310.1 hypothetical protein ASUIS_0819 [Arcobacter suis CECT 7833]RWS46544.1 hypothetical protein CKA55_07345 [Arcobacter suis]
MTKIALNELDDVEKVECVEIRVCTRTRACKWKGTYPQLALKKKDEVEQEHICPKCGNNEFYIEYMPLYKYKKNYVDMTKALHKPSPIL